MNCTDDYEVLLQNLRETASRDAARAWQTQAQAERERDKAYMLIAQMGAELRAIDAALYLDRPGLTRSAGDRVRAIRVLRGQP